MTSSASDRVQRHRAKLRDAGLRPVQIWVPDIHRPGFAEECHRQSRLLRNDPLEQEMLDWLESAADQDDWK